eukprot:1979212-Amphidinium_carterae.1
MYPAGNGKGKGDKGNKGAKNKKGGNGKAGAAPGAPASGSGGSSKDIVCHNCGRKGHKKADCWRAGGGSAKGAGAGKGGKPVGA